MFITNGMSATLIKYNREPQIRGKGSTGVWDDEYTETEEIVLCPYNQDVTVAFGNYTVPEAEGYFIVKNTTDVKEGDQVIFQDKTYTILKVKDNWIWNKIANFTIAVK
jgi:hypothetical protein